MCLNPKRILNPSKWIDPNSCQSLYIEVPCGNCSECILSYRNDWRNRAYYETLDTFAAGGYVLFDTLTYRNGNLPHLSDWLDVPADMDFPCFSKIDLNLFFSNLRRKLRKYDVANNLRYFIGLEYGDDIRFTRRPHYHVLFFVRCALPFAELSKAIANSWPNGRTDGIPYRGYNYVSSQCVFHSLVESQRFSVNYVTKYCTKNFSYNSLVYKRLHKILEFDFALYQIAKDYILPNHYQSKSFGTNALIKFVGRENLLRDGRFKIIGSNGIIRFVSLSKSIQRKLLYDYYRDSDGCVHWKLNKDGFDYKKRFAFRSINFLAKRIAGSPFGSSYVDAKKEVFDLFFKNSRFNTGSIDYVIDNSYNIDFGLRNYACKDFGFLRKKVFTYRDFGNAKDGFKYSFLKKDDIVELGELVDLTQECDLPHIFDYRILQSQKGDGALDVLKLMHRLKHIYKVFDYG